MNNIATFVAIETAVAGGSLSLWKDGTEVGRWVGETKVSRAENLLANIDTLLSAHGSDRSELGMVAVSAGPGSFTGIRVGLATALGLSRGLSIVVSSVSLLESMIAAHQGNSVDTTAAIPMGRGSVCVQSTIPGGTSLDTPHTQPETEFLERLIDERGTKVLHQLLYEKSDGSGSLVNAGLNMASYIGAYCHAQPTSTSPPMFISKSF
jgi:tRNA threonylcarbamoyl adenosine modification protein YeaZ